MSEGKNKDAPSIPAPVPSPSEGPVAVVTRAFTPEEELARFNNYPDAGPHCEALLESVRLALVQRDEARAQVADLALLVRSLLAKMRVHKICGSAEERALSYLKRKGLTGSVLREKENS